LKPEKRRRFALSAGAFTLAGVFAVVVYLLQPALHAPVNTRAGATVLVGAFTLIGALVGASVVAIGHAISHTESRKKHALALAADARADIEQGLHRTQTIATALGLLAEPGEGESSAKSSGAILLLRELNVDLALNLAAEMWPKGDMSNSVALELCDAAFRQGNPISQRLAAALMSSNKDAMVSADEILWPESLTVETTRLDRDASELLQAILEGLTRSDKISDEARVFFDRSHAVVKRAKPL
jgi:hypothetical protein